MWGLIAARDFVDAVYSLTRKEGTIVSAARSLPHPHVDGYVRGTNALCGYVLRPTERATADTEPDTDVIYIVDSELGGSLPESIIERALPSNLLAHVAALKKSVARACRKT